MKTDNGNVLNEDGISGRNDVAKAVKRICEKRDQGFANLSQSWREEAECEVITEEEQLGGED